MKVFLVLAAATGCCALQKWCLDAPQAGWPVCDPKQPLDTRSADIVSRISLEDKIQLLSGGQYFGGGADRDGIAAPSIGLGPYNFWTEAAHGLLGVNYTAELPGATNTALPITVSASFNRSLWSATGNTIGREGRAFMNANIAFSTFWAPVINIVRDPRWGRNLESAGEECVRPTASAAPLTWDAATAHPPPPPLTHTHTHAPHALQPLSHWPVRRHLGRGL